MWMSLEKSRVEMRPTRKDKSGTDPLIGGPRNGRDSTVCRGLGEGKAALSLNGDKKSLSGVMKKVLERDGRGGSQQCERTSCH